MKRAVTVIEGVYDYNALGAYPIGSLIQFSGDVMNYHIILGNNMTWTMPVLVYDMFTDGVSGSTIVELAKAGMSADDIINLRKEGII